MSWLIQEREIGGIILENKIFIIADNDYVARKQSFTNY